MSEEDRATLFFTQDLLATLMRAMAGSAIIPEKGVKMLIEKSAAHCISRYPDLRERIERRAAALRQGVEDECALPYAQEAARRFPLR